MKVIRCIRNSSLAGSGMSALGCGVRQGSPADRPVLDGEVEHGSVDAAGQDAADVQQRREAEGWRPRRLPLRLRGPHDIFTWMACGVEDWGRAWPVAAGLLRLDNREWASRNPAGNRGLRPTIPSSSARATGVSSHTAKFDRSQPIVSKHDLLHPSTHKQQIYERLLVRNCGTAKASLRNDVQGNS